MEWMPIESAPMGVDILVYGPDGWQGKPSQAIVIGRIQTGWSRWDGTVQESYAIWDDGDRDISWSPTHWMPLPPPPKEERD